MTIQNLFVAELADVLNVQLKCKCGAQIWFNLDKGAQMPDECPQCRSRWKGHEMGHLSTEGIDALLLLLRQARTQPEGRTLQVNLVFSHKPSDQQSVP